MASPSVPKAALEQLHICGLEHLQSAIDNGKGAIVWESSYFGGRLLAKRILHQNGFAVEQVHAEKHIGGFHNGRSLSSWLRRRIVQRFFENCKKRFVAAIIYLPRSDSLAFTRVLLGRLKQNGILCLAADGRLGQKLLATKLLGHKSSFQTGAISLAKFSGAPVLPVFCFQNEGKTNLVIEPPLRIDSDLDRERALEKTLLQYANLLESYIRKYPEQYRNWHSPWGRPQRTTSGSDSILSRRATL
jgi:lauroyl/myristoyl acyltransferase